MTTRPPAAQPAIPEGWKLVPVAKRQYYHRVIGCRANYPTDPECICWHDEGTGPLGDGAPRIWRDKPAAQPQRGERRARVGTAVSTIHATHHDGVPTPAVAEARGLLDIALTIELGLARGYTSAELLDENSPVRERIRAAIARCGADGWLRDLIESTADWRELSRREPTGATQAARDVLAERRRQIDREGWTLEHDDVEHDEGELASAGAAYALAAADSLHPMSQGDGGFSEAPPSCWPTDWRWNPADPRRNLVKAGALILAEIERIDRAALAQAKEGS